MEPCNYLIISDLHLRGGPQYTYAVQVSKAEPHFLIEIDSDKTLLAPGIASVFYVRALRKNGFAGDIQLAVEGLPAGVTAVAGKILANANDGDVICVVNLDTAMLDLPVESTKDINDRFFEAYTERIPPLDTPVLVILEPAPAPAKNKK